MKLIKFVPLLFVLAASHAFADSYLISIDTSSLAPNTTGFLDFFFNGSFPATATITNFANPGGSLNPGSLFTQGTVMGALPGTVTLGANNADYDEGITVGSPIQFGLTLTGTPGGQTGDVFTLSFYNSTFTGGLLTGNQNDFWLAQFQLSTNGSITPVAYANPSGGPSYATVTSAAAAPEPSTMAMFVAAGLAVCGWRLCARV
jgi:hypothetical protein